MNSIYIIADNLCFICIGFLNYEKVDVSIQILKRPKLTPLMAQ